MNDTELAEKVAMKLMGDAYTLDVSPEENFSAWANDKYGFYWDETTDIEEMIFSWFTFGLMVEDAEERGWQIGIERNYISFYGFRGLQGITKAHPIGKHGHVKSCALAYLETFKNE